MDDVDKISAPEIAELYKQKESFQFIDMSDYEIGRSLPFPTEQIHFSKLHEQIAKISKHGMVVIACKYGEKSFFATHMLQKQYGLGNLRSLTGGIESLINFMK